MHDVYMRVCMGCMHICTCLHLYVCYVCMYLCMSAYVESLWTSSKIIPSQIECIEVCTHDQYTCTYDWHGVVCISWVVMINDMYKTFIHVPSARAPNCGKHIEHIDIITTIVHVCMYDLYVCIYAYIHISCNVKGHGF